MAEITMKNIVKKYGDGFPAVNDVSLDVADGEFMILVGPSGCGKSTLLRMIVGLEDITSGDMVIGAPGQRQGPARPQPVDGVPELRLVSAPECFREHRLPLRRAAGCPRKRSASACRRLLKPSSSPSTWTANGEPVRWPAATRRDGRAIVRQADAFLFDEPLSNLDAKLRGQMRMEILRLQRRLGITTVYVTHDQTEAMTLGTGWLSCGAESCSRSPAPASCKEQPVNLFVAGFIGSPPMNMVPASVEGDELKMPFTSVPMRDEWSAAIGDRTVLIAGIRPGSFEEASMVDSDKVDQG